MPTTAAAPGPLSVSAADAVATLTEERSRLTES
jgi:hypothetical protein